MNKLYKLATTLFICLFLLCIKGLGQINGPTTVTIGGQDTYVFDNGFYYSGVQWTSDVGSVISSYQSGTQYVAIFQWQTTTGTGSINFRDETNDISTSLSIIVQQCASTFPVMGGGTYCGTPLVISLTNYNGNLQYQLIKDGNNVGGLTYPPSWNVSAAGTYTVMAVNPGVCSQLMTGSAIVYGGTVPTSFGISGGGPYCVGSAGPTISLASSQSGVTYARYRNGSFLENTNGTGSALSWSNNLIAGTYTIIGTHSSGCTNSMSGNATVSINSLPQIYTMTGGGLYCTPESVGVSIGLNGSESGVNYFLSGGSMLAGTGAALTWNSITTGTYTVNAVSATSGCSRTMNGIIGVVTGTTPTVYAVGGGGVYCSGSNGASITLGGSQSGVTYSLYFNGGFVSSKAGTGSLLSWDNNTGTGSYTIVASHSSGCSATMSGSATVSVSYPPTIFNVSGGGFFCSPAVNGVSISLNASETGFNYQLKVNGVNSGTPIPGSGSALTWNSQNTAGSYTVTATNTVGGCSQEMSGAVTVSVGTTPTTFTIGGGGAYCSGSTGSSITLSGSQTDATYSLYRGATFVTSKIGTGGLLTWTNNTTAGSYTITALHTSGCTATMIGSVSVSVNSLPAAYSMGGGGSYCSPGANGVTVTLSGSQSGINYQLKAGASNSGAAIAGTNAALSWPSQTAAGTYTVVATNSATGCVKTMTGTATVSTIQGAVGGTLSPSASEVFNNANGGDITLGGKTGTIDRWKKNDGSGWADITPLYSGNPYSYYNITTTTQYQALVTNGSCPQATSSIATVTVYTKPIISGTNIINYAGSVVLTVQTGYYSYQWYKNNSVVSGATTNQLTVTTPGTYKVIVKGSATSPSSTADDFNVTSPADGQTGINFHKVTTIKKTGQTVWPDVYTLSLSDYVQEISYTDGLGRTVQQVSAAQSPAQKDLVSVASYDNRGRSSTTYLPYAASSFDGTYRPSALTSASGYTGSAQYQFYQTSTVVAQSNSPLAKSIYDNSPLNRVVEQGAPGTDWQPGAGHTARLSYLVNSQDAAAPAAIKNIRIWNSGGPTGAYYANGLLTVDKTVDENNNESYVFTDKAGRQILKRVQLDETIESVMVNWLDTYYVYDQLGNLAMQIPPRASAKLNSGTVWSNAFRDEWCFIYNYDTRNRLVSKKVPGADYTYYVYDVLNRLVLTQDGTLRPLNKWAFIKYDAMGRAVMSGLYLNATQTTLAGIQTLVGGMYSIATNPYAETKGTTLHGYTNVSFPTANADGTALEIFNVSYYDNYDFDFNGTDDYSYITQSIAGEGVQSTAFGLPSGSKSLVIGSSTWLYRYVFYDQFGRIIQTRSNNHLSATIDNLATVIFDFEGKVTQTKVYHNAGGTNQTTVVNKTTYDHAGRPFKIYQSLNGSSDQLVAQYSYNELGQVIDKKLHNTSGSNFLQSVDYRYNIRGWMSSINNAQLTSDGATNDETNDYFGMELVYNVSDAGISNTSFYNGNISALKWKGMSGNGLADQRSYKYSYDKNDRLKAATFQAHTGTAWSKEANTLNETLTYDHNGNTLTLARNQNLRGLSGITVTSSPQAIDNLTYSYASGGGNRLTKVEDAATAVGGFRNGVNATTEYSYGTEGSITKDDNKGISAITYNALGKVQQVTLTGTPAKTILYTYDAGGSKLKMVVSDGTTTTTTDYINGFVYTNSALTFFSSPEGRVVKNGSTLEYQYAIADHQGNTRVLFSAVTPAAVAVTATMEASTNSNFQGYPAGGSRSSLNLYDHTDAGTTYTYSQLLNAGYNSQVGVAKSYKVYPGDKVKIEAYAKYSNPTSTGSNIAGFASMLLNAFGVPAPAGGEVGTISSALNTWGGLVAAGSGGASSGPKAFVNIIVFDKDYKFLDFAFEAIDPNAQQMGVSPVVSHDYMSREYVAKEAGYIFAYISNENSTQVDVYFDDVTMTYTPGNVVQYNEYYPFGLQAANSWTRDNSIGNNLLANGGTEFNATSSLYDLDYRNYDPLLGRMNGVDPLADSYSSITPYNFSFNDPVYWSDPSGAEPCMFCPGGSAYRSSMIERNDGGSSSGVIMNGQSMISRDPFGNQYWSGNSVSWSMFQNAGYLGTSGIIMNGQTTTSHNGQAGYWRDYDESVYTTGSPEDGDYIAHGKKSDWISINQKEDGIGQPGTWESMIPIWGSGRAAVDDFQNGRWGWGLVNTALAVSDVFLVKSIATGLAKGGLKLAGSSSWAATRKYYLKKGFAKPFQPLHHAFIHRNGPIGKFVPNIIKNQMWNLKSFATESLHIRAGHGKNFLGQPGYGILGQLWYGTPNWTKPFSVSLGGRILDEIED